MLKDVTLGQYFPGETIVHRLDPRIKIIIVVIYIVTLFMAKAALSYAVMFTFLAVAVALSKIKLRVMLKGLKPLLIIMVFTALLNVLYTPGETVFEWWIFKATDTGIVTACFMVLRIIMLVTGTFLLTYTTSPMSLTDGLERLFAPLKKIRVPVHELAMMMTIALRFIPTLIEETDKIISAQRARGADFESGNIARRARALIPVLVPLFFSAMRRADELATAMECRCYNGGEGRTRLRQLSLMGYDFAALLVVTLTGTLTAVLGHFGM